MDIAFVSNTGRIGRPFYDPATRYRAFAPAEYLRQCGHRTCCLSQEQFEENIDQFEQVPIIVFHRPKASDAMLRFVARNRQRLSLIADYDDLVFDVAATADTPAVQSRGEDPTLVARNLASQAEIGEMFPLRTASTAPLAEAADRLLSGETLVIHNALDRAYLAIADALARVRRPALRYGLGYFSGTASHNHDLRTIAAPIAQYLAADSARQMLLLGPVQIPGELARFKPQIRQQPVTSFYDMPHAIAACRTVLGPLVENAFSRCKSGLKFFEAAVLGTRVAATPIPDIDRFNSPLLHKCRSDQDWLEAFKAPRLPPRICAEARQQVAAQADLRTQMSIWATAFL